jgi:hypothetical protein
MTNNESSPPRLAGGIFIALGMLGGAIIGVVMRQPSAGMVIGFGIGAAIAAAVWFFDRKRG